MEITANEIANIEEVGMLDKQPVKLIRTKGGFWIAIGKPKNKFKEEALAAGSHAAIVKYNVEKLYPDFQPSLMKSEYLSDSTVVEKHSHFLSEEHRKSGHDVYSVQNGNDVEFHVTKQNHQVALVKSELNADVIVVKNLDIPKEFTRAVAGAVTEKAFSCNKPKIKLERK